jgi:hypothetical protein
MMISALISVFIAYVGAGVFYAAADMASSGLGKEFASPSTMMAFGLAVAIWGPACLLAMATYARLGGWRPVLLYFNADVAPALAIFVGGVAFAVSS